VPCCGKQDVAPTLANILKIAYPNASTGHVLKEVVTE